MLGISKALRKIQGLDPGAIQPPGGEPEPLCIHFDLKPDNILIEEEGNWVITDFGQAVITYAKIDKTPRIANRQGTDAYAPPEIENIDMENGRRYDVWSLGCIFLEVAAFVVLGYPGLTGSNDPEDRFLGLDQARSAKQTWAQGGDHRFFYRQSYQGPFVVKSEIRNFMQMLQQKVDIGFENSERSKAFFKKVLHLIEQMLRVSVEERIDITGVVRTLDDAISQASPDVTGLRRTEMIPYKGESVLGGPDLSRLHIYYWAAATNDWVGANIDAFENDAGSLRLAYWSTMQGPDVNIQRDHHKIIPAYGFWGPGISGTSKDWLQILSFVGNPGDVSEVGNTRFSFAGVSALDDARLVQSKLTSQLIVASFDLDAVILEKFIPFGNKIVKGWHRVSKSSRAEESAQEMQRKMHLGPATIQIWVEQVDEATEKRRNRRFSTSQTKGVARPPRAQALFESGYREIPPRRIVIYLHQHKFICTIKMDVNWVVDKNTKDDCRLVFIPNEPDKDPHFVACWLRPTIVEQERGFPAGVPLTPGSLHYFEDLDRFEADRFELRFASGEGRNLFVRKYMEVKQDWDERRRELEKTQEYMPVNRRPEHFPHPDSASLKHISKPKYKARFSSLSSPQTISIRAKEEALPQNDKGKGRMTGPSMVTSHGDASGNFLRVPLMSPQHLPPTPRRGSDSVSSGEEKKQIHYLGGYGRGRSSRPPQKVLESRQEPNPYIGANHPNMWKCSSCGWDNWNKFCAQCGERHPPR